MAFSGNVVVYAEDGTGWQQAVVGATADLADGNWTVAGTNATITEIDNSTLLARWYKVRLKLEFDSVTGAPADKNVEIWIIDTSIDGANGGQMPTLTGKGAAKKIGVFVMPSTVAANTSYYLSTVIPTFGLAKFKLALYNDTDEAIDSTDVAFDCDVLALADKIQTA